MLCQKIRDARRVPITWQIPNMARKSLDPERQKYRERIATALDSSEDPLAAYEEFVRWTLDSYAKDDPNSGLFDLLEETTKQFRDDDAYKGNRRYLDLWIMYAKMVEDPGEVYAFLVKRGIGTSFYVLYDEYAKVFERNGL
jgi:checkpoint serine/threonine-protein kinase